MNKVMLIDGNFEYRKSFYKVLKEIDKDIQLIPYNSGLRALDYFSQPDAEIPDCIFLDTLIPDMNGFETLRLLKQKEQLKNIPIILCASADPNVYIDIAQTLGAYSCICKNLEHDSAISQIRSLLITTENGV